MTLQEIFDHIAEHLLTQGERSVEVGIGCAYRAEDGKACAAGCLMVGELRERTGILHPTNLTAFLTGCGHAAALPRKFREAHRWYEANVDELPETAATIMALARDLQAVHDAQKQVTLWRGELRALAIARGLEWKHDETGLHRLEVANEATPEGSTP